MKLDRNGLGILDEETCRRLLPMVPVARIGIALGGAPVVLPVNFVVLDDSVVFRSARGSKLDAALTEAVVAVEVDDYDADARTGWSVVVKGRATEIDDPEVISRAQALDLVPWGIADADHYIAVRMDLVSGRCVGELEILRGHEGSTPAPEEIGNP